MNKAFVAILGLFCIGQYVSIAVGNVFLGLAILFAIILGIKNKKELKKYKLSKTEKGILTFVLVSLVLCFTSLEVNHSLKVFANNYLYRTMPLVIVMILGITVLKSKNQIVREEIFAKLINVSIVGYVINTCYVIYQAVVLSLVRPNGFFGHPMTYASWSCLFVPMLVILFIETDLKSELNKKMLYLGAFLLSLVGVILNATRGAFLAIAIVLLILIIYYGFRGYKKVCATILILCFVIPSGFLILYPSSFKKLAIVQKFKIVALNNTNSGGDRIYLWKSAIQMVKDYPLTGVGLGEFGKTYHEKYILKEAREPNLDHAHNIFFQVAAENGIVGLGAFLFMFGAIYKEQYIFWEKTKSKYSVIILSMTTCLLLQGLTQYNFGDSAVIKNYWLMLSLCLAANKTIDLKKKQVK